MRPSSAMPSSDDLKPCPFCGDSGNPIIESDIDIMAGRFIWVAYCFRCHVRTRAHNTQWLAVNDWNRRPEVAASEEESK